MIAAAKSQEVFAAKEVTALKAEIAGFEKRLAFSRSGAVGGTVSGLEMTCNEQAHCNNKYRRTSMERKDRDVRPPLVRFKGGRLAFDFISSVVYQGSHIIPNVSCPYAHKLDISKPTSCGTCRTPSCYEKAC